MGNTGGRGCHEHYDGRIPSKVQSGTSPSLGPSPRFIHVRSGDYPPRFLYTKVVAGGSNKGNQEKNSPSFFSAVHQSQEKRKTASSHRPVASQHSSGRSNFQNGNCGGNFQKHHGSFMGLFSRHRRRILPCSNELGVPQVPSLQTTRENVRLPIPPLRVIPSSMGILKGDQAYKTPPSHPSNLYFQLFGRLSHFLPFSGETAGSLKNCGGSSTKLGLQNQLGEVKPYSLSVDRISRGNLGSSQARAFSSTRQDHTHQVSMHGVQSEVGINQKRVGEFDRSDELRFNIHQIGEASPSTNSHVDESTYSSMLQGCSCSSERGFKGVASLLDVSGISESTSSDAGSQTISRPDDRRVSGRMVRDSSTSEGIRHMVAECDSPIYELERAEGGSTSSCRVSVCVEGEIGATVVGQHNSNSLPKKSGFGKTSTPSFPDNRNSVILQELENLSSSSSSKGCPKRSGGPRFSPTSYCHGMVPGQADVFLGEFSSSSIPSRSIRHKGEHPASSVCVPLPGPPGSGFQRIQLEVGRLDVHLPHAPNELLRGRCELSPVLPREGCANSPLLAIEGMVPSTSTTVQGSSNPPSSESLVVSTDFEGSDHTQQRTILETSRMDTLINSLLRKGANENSINIIKNSHKPSTLKQYQGVWKKFVSFLTLEKIPHNKVNVYVVMNFLAYQHIVMGLAYRTITTYKCALVQPLYENLNIRLDVSSMEFFMRGIFNLNPPKPAPMAEWSLDSLLLFLVGDHFEPLHSMSINVITNKFLCLLLLATGRRIDEIGHLSQKHDFSLNGESVSIPWLPKYTPKYHNKDFQPKLPSFERLASDSNEDLLLCPFRAFQIYLGRIRSNPRGSINRSLWPLPSKDLTKSLTKMFISTTVQAKHSAGDLSDVPIGPHQMRKFAASYSAKMINSSVEGERKLMERMGCKTMSVLKRHYINNIPRVSLKMVIPVGTCVPDIHFGP